MATTIIIRPDADAAAGPFGGLNPPTSLTGAATEWEAESDQLDSSYLSMSGGSNLPTDNAYTLGNPTVGSNQRCARIRPCMRMRKSGGNINGLVDFWLEYFNAGVYKWNSNGSAVVSSGVITDYRGPWQKPSELAGTLDLPANGYFEQTHLDNLRFEHVHSPQGTGTSYAQTVYECWGELELIEAPTATWDTTYQDADVTRRPYQAWNFIGNGEIQKKFQVKIFTLAQTVAGGFNPDSTTPIWDSGQVTSSAANVTPNVDLTLNTDYKSYLKVAKDLDGQDWWTAAWIVSGTWTVTELPVVDVTAPTGATVNTSTPTVTWTYADGNSTDVVPQSRYQAKIYRKNSGSWPAGFPGDASTFDAAVTGGQLTLIYDTGIVVSAATSFSLSGTGVSLANSTNYRTYMQVGKLEIDPGFTNLMLSAWAFEEFTTSFAQPPAPTISAVRDGAKLSDHLITVTPQAGTPSAEYWNVYRSIAGGPYLPFHIGGGLSSVNKVLSGATVFRDTEAPQNVLVTYAAESVDTGLGVPVASNLVTAAVTNNLNQVWLKVPLNPALDMRLLEEQTWLTVGKVRPRTVHAPLGRNSAVVVDGGNQYDTFQLVTIVLTRTNYDKLQALLNQNAVFFVQTPKQSWYAEISGDVSEEAHLWDGLHGEEDVWRFTLPFVEVSTDAPV